MISLDPDLVRALVGQALEEGLGIASTGAQETNDPFRDHPSHCEVVIECGGESDFLCRKSYLIEPHRLCNNSGYCKKLGY